VWTSLCDSLTHHALVNAGVGPVRNPVLQSVYREEPGALTQGAPVFPGSSRLGIEPKTPGWLVQDRTTSPSGIWSPPRPGMGPVRNPVL
jgi:hypothetical protein